MTTTDTSPPLPEDIYETATWWFVGERSYQAAREIGSTPALQVEWSRRLDYNPLIRIAELEEVISGLVDWLDRTDRKGCAHTEHARRALGVNNDND